MFADLLSWSKKEFSHLPWRKRRTLYKTLVSEIMLQQTTVGTVLNHFERFLEIYPNLKTLSKASEDELLINWKGLGYYRRAKNLLKAAQFIQKEFKGKIPLEKEILLTIPGVGEYTANALLSIGNNQAALSVDANIERVFARVFNLKEELGKPLKEKIKEIQNTDPKVKKVLKSRARDFNESLMDLGRVTCQSRRADCLICPLNGHCLSLKNGNPLALPIKSEKKKEEHYLQLLRVIVKKGDKVLAYKKKEGEWLSGQYEIPTFVLNTTDKSLKQYPRLKKKFGEKLKIYKTGITKYKIENHIFECDLKTWKSLNFPNKAFYKELNQQSNFSTASLKAFKKLNIEVL